MSMTNEYPYDSSNEEDVEEQEQILLLTRNEALFIDDSLSMIIEQDPIGERLGTVRPMAHTAGLPAPVDLLEKIGHAILFTTDPDNKGEPASVPVSDTDLYMLREITHSYVKIGDEPVGFNLKRKIYTLLYSTEYEREKIAKRLLAQVDLSAIPSHEVVEDTSKAKRSTKETS